MIHNLGWMTTFTGRKFYPLDPKPGEVSIKDIAHALSLICRFGGHCKHFYSVAQHSILVANLVEGRCFREGIPDTPRLVQAALLHDAAEAYLGDMIRPLKNYALFASPFLLAEEKVEAAIADHFNLPYPLSDPWRDIIKWADNVMLKNEHEQIIEDGRYWDVDTLSDAPKIPLSMWLPIYAEQRFLALAQWEKGRL